MSDLDKTMQIMSNPIEHVVKPVFPQNRNKNKNSQKLHFISKKAVSVLFEVLDGVVGSGLILCKKCFGTQMTTVLCFF